MYGFQGGPERPVKVYILWFGNVLPCSCLGPLPAAPYWFAPDGRGGVVEPAPTRGVTIGQDERPATYGNIGNIGNYEACGNIKDVESKIQIILVFIVV